MKRHRALVPLSHDHHHALVQARRLRRAVEGTEPGAAAASFLRFFAAESVRHFREEEELLFPRVVGFDEAREPLVRALLDHQRLHALAAELQARLDGGDRVTVELVRELGTLLEEHVRLEERELFPLIERLLDDATLEALAQRVAPPAEPVARGPGPVWGTESEELNATVLAWDAGSGPPEHVNDERDVLLVVVAGAATLALDGERRELAPGDVVIVGKGRKRRITAGPAGVRYLSAHRRRPPLQVEPRIRPAADER